MAGGQKELLSALRHLYKNNDWARAIFDRLAARKNSPSSTTIEQWTHLLGVSQSEAISYAKQLEEAGCGRYIVGRRGGTSRFEWAYNAISIGQVASRQADDLIDLDEVKAKETKAEEAASDMPAEAPRKLTIDEAKEGLARTFGVKPEQIEIIIKA